MHNDFVKPAKALTFDPAEFWSTLQYALEQSASPCPAWDPTKRGLLLQDEDGKVTRIQFTDCPENRFGFAVAERYQDNRPKLHSFMWRWFALHELLHSGKLSDRWYRRGQDGDLLDDRVLEVAASFPLKRRGGFGHHAFVAELEKGL